MEKKKLKSIILKGSVLTLVFSLGLAVGGYIGYRMAAPSFLFMNTMFRVGLATEYANLQYFNAGYPEAKEALLKLLTLFEDLKSQNWYENQKRAYYLETGLTYARLSLLEEKNGNVLEKDKFMRQAADRLRQAGWKDYSEQRIREVVGKLDRQNPFKTKGSDK